MVLKEVETLLDLSKYPEDLFGWDATRAEAAKIFKRYKHMTHEDKFEDGDKALAHDLFIRLGKLWELAADRFKSGDYGDKTVKPVEFEHSITSKLKTYNIVSVFDTANLCNVYATDDGEILKVARTHKDNDLLKREVEVFKKFADIETDIIQRTTPKLIESFEVRSLKKEKIRVNVTENYESYVPLSLIKSAYPDGLHGRHIVWIWKRILMTLGFSHAEKVIHGCLNLDNIIVDPKDHSIAIVDWCYSVDSGENLVLIDNKYKGYYSKEVFDKKPVDNDLDIYMAAKCIEDLIGPDCPILLKNLIKSALIPNKSMRYNDAWDLYNHVSDVAKKAYGEPKFIELKI